MPQHPLTDEDLVQLNENLARLNEADEQIRLAERAGIDVAELKTQSRDNRASLLKIKASYFPGK